MSRFNWDKVREQDRALAESREWLPRVRPDYVDPAERKQVLAIAAAYADRNRYCAKIVKDCGTGIGRGVTRKQADMIYQISREQTARTPRSRSGNPGARDFQKVQDTYR